MRCSGRSWRKRWSFAAERGVRRTRAGPSVTVVNQFPMRCSPIAMLIPLLLLGCDSIGFGDPGRRQLNALVEKHSSKQEVVSALGPGSTWFGREGDTDFRHLRAFLDREPTSWGRPLRQAVERGEGILSYTSAWQMTWLFFDGEDRLRGYWITAQ